MLRRNVLGALAAAIGLVSSAVPAPAAVIATGRVTLAQTLGGTNAPPVFSSVAYKFAVPLSGSLLDRQPGLFSNQTITPGQTGGTLLVATSTSDPFFNDVAAHLTDGLSQTASSVIEWKPNSTFVSSLNSSEGALFRLPGTTVDLQGQTIRAVGLQVNLVDQFFYTARDTNKPAARYRFDATLILSDSETIDGPVLPVAIAMAGRDNAFRVMPGEDLLLDASKSIGDITKYEWDINRDGFYDIMTTDPQVLLGPSQYVDHLSRVVPGPIILRVTDAAGNTALGTSDSILYVPEPSAAVMVGLAGVLGLTRRRPAR